MNNFKKFENWYSKRVSDNYNEKIIAEIKNTGDFGWKIFMDLSKTSIKTLSGINESKKKSRYNFYKITGKGKKFYAEGDFTKLDFLLGKFLFFIGENEKLNYEKDLFQSEEIQEFIFSGSEDDYVYLHYTDKKKTAEKIIKEGFKFISFDKTTVKIQNDLIDLNYNHLLRKPFGKYVAVICISKKIYKKYFDLINKSENKYLKPEEVLVVKKEYSEETDEYFYTLSPEYVKGFFNYTDAEIIKNPGFLSSYDNPSFRENIL